MSIAALVKSGYGEFSVPALVFDGYILDVAQSHHFPINRVMRIDGQPLLVTGDTFKCVATLLAGITQAPYALDTATAIKACIVSADHGAQWCDPVSLVNGAWANGAPVGQVLITLPKTITQQIAANMKQGDTMADIELQVSFGSEDFTWYGQVYARHGFI